MQEGRLAIQQVVPLETEPLLLVESELGQRLQKSRQQEQAVRQQEERLSVLQHLERCQQEQLVRPHRGQTEKQQQAAKAQQR